MYAVDPKTISKFDLLIFLIPSSSQFFWGIVFESRIAIKSPLDCRIPKFLASPGNKLSTLKYFNGSPVIKKIKRISKPGIRVYSKISDLEKPYGGLGISILSTPKGVMSDQQARKNNVGGEILCEVF